MADNLLSGLDLSFDGQRLTDGDHPLRVLTVLLLSALLGKRLIFFVGAVLVVAVLVVGPLMGGGVVQLEGLVGDAAMLNNIRTSRSLNQVLADLGVTYYVRSAEATRMDGSCYVTREPEMAGPSSPVMVGRFCSEPVADFTYGSFRTMVFKVGCDVTQASLVN